MKYRIGISSQNEEIWKEDRRNEDKGREERQNRDGEEVGTVVEGAPFPQHKPTKLGSWGHGCVSGGGGGNDKY